MRRHSSFKFIRAQYTELIWKGVSRYYKTSFYLSRDDATIEHKEINKDTFEKYINKNDTRIFDIEEEFLVVDKHLLSMFFMKEHGINESEARKIIFAAIDEVRDLKRNIKQTDIEVCLYEMFEKILNSRLEEKGCA